jgi:hypothetical protein
MRCHINVSIEAGDIIAHWERLKVPILRLKRLSLKDVGLAFGCEWLVVVFVGNIAKLTCTLSWDTILVLVEKILKIVIGL